MTDAVSARPTLACEVSREDPSEVVPDAAFDQPIAIFAVTEALSLSLGDLEMVIDLDDGSVRTLPIGVQANLVVHAGDQPLIFYVNPQANILDEPGTFEWLVVIGAGMLMPGT
jgi:hypothetical protein